MQKILSSLFSKKKFTLKSEGTSMMPVLFPDDILYFKKTRSKNLKVNDIILAKNKKLFVHRLIYKSSKFAVTKGDNNFTSDGKVKYKDVAAKLISIKRGNKIINPENIYLIQSSFYFREIVKIKNALYSNNIDFLFLKGLPLHLYKEKKQPGRIYADCDILIRKEDFSKVSEILKKNGFNYHESSYSLIHKLLKNKPTEFAFVKQIQNFPVVFDVHAEANFLLNQIGKLDILYSQKLLDRLTLKFMKEKKEAIVDGEKFPLLSDNNLIIYLSLHFFHHNFRGAFRLDLIDKIINKNKKINWRELTEKIIEFKLQNYIYTVFLLLKKYYKTEIDRKFLVQITPSYRNLNFIIRELLKVNIFDEQSNFESGIKRFKYIFYLSGGNKILKYLIFFYPSVIYSITWVMLKSLKDKTARIMQLR